MKTTSLRALLRAYFSLGIGPIIGTLPSQLVNGTPIDATQVMADLQFIQAQVNQNAAPISGVVALTPAYVASVGGTPNAITLSPANPITSYQPGQTYFFLPTANNTGATTINTSGLGARNLLYADGTAMTGGELLAGQPILIEDNGAAYVLVNSAQATGITNWTPTISFGGGTTGITYSLQTGKACKIGRIAFFSFVVQLSNKGSSVGTAQVDGLPYPINAGWLGDQGGPVVASNLTFAGYNSFGYVLGGSSLTVLNTTTGAAFTALTNAAFSNTTLLAGSCFYAV